MLRLLFIAAGLVGALRPRVKCQHEWTTLAYPPSCWRCGVAK